LIFDIFI
jgi:hypothetical protein